jgi:hypothetical protein
MPIQLNIYQKVTCEALRSILTERTICDTFFYIKETKEKTSCRQSHGDLLWDTFGVIHINFPER